MKKLTRSLTVVGAICAFIIIGSVVLILAGGHFSIELPVERTAIFAHQELSSFPAKLQVAGNRIVDASGDAVRLRGAMPIDPARLADQDRFNKDFFVRLANLGANVVRIPVHPHNWEDDDSYLWRYLEPIVGWAGELGLYVILDWHYIGNVETGEGPNAPDTRADSMELTTRFWNSIAHHFRHAPHVLFEVVNEPQSITSSNWRRIAADLIHTIRSAGARQIVIVGGTDYGRDLSWVVDTPIADTNVAYSSHVFPAHSRALWDYWFGDVALVHPVLVTEMGYLAEPVDQASAYLVGTRANYAEPLLSYMSARGIGWVAAWYDDGWLPPMYEEDWARPTEFGALVETRLRMNNSEGDGHGSE